MLLHGLLTGVCGLIYVCIYVLLKERTLLCNPLVLCFWRNMNFSWRSYFLFILFQLPFGSDMLSSCTTLMVYRKSRLVKKTSIILCGVLKKKISYENYFIVCLLLSRRMTSSWNPFIYIFNSTFIWIFIYLVTFHFVPIFNGFIPFLRFMLFHAFIHLHVCLFFIRVDV